MLKTVGFPSTRTGDQTIVDGNLVIGHHRLRHPRPRPVMLEDDIMADWNEIDLVKYGVLWQKVEDMDKKVDKMDNHLNMFEFIQLSRLD